MDTLVRRCLALLVTVTLSAPVGGCKGSSGPTHQTVPRAGSAVELELTMSGGQATAKALERRVETLADGLQVDVRDSAVDADGDRVDVRVVVSGPATCAEPATSELRTALVEQLTRRGAFTVQLAAPSSRRDELLRALEGLDGAKVQPLAVGRDAAAAGVSEMGESALQARLASLEVPRGYRAVLEMRRRRAAGAGGDPEPIVWLVLDQAALGPADIAEVEVRKTPSGHSALFVILTDQGRRRFTDLTTAGVGRYLLLMIDERVVSAPVIHDPIRGGRLQLTPAGGAWEAAALAALLEAGPLPEGARVLESGGACSEPTP